MNFSSEFLKIHNLLEAYKLFNPVITFDDKKKKLICTQPIPSCDMELIDQAQCNLIAYRDKIINDNNGSQIITDHIAVVTSIITVMSEGINSLKKVQKKAEDMSYLISVLKKGYNAEIDDSFNDIIAKCTCDCCNELFDPFRQTILRTYCSNSIAKDHGNDMLLCGNCKKGYTKGSDEDEEFFCAFCRHDDAHRKDSVIMLDSYLMNNIFNN